MFFRFRFWFRPKVKNILSVIHCYFNTWSKIHHNHILGLEEVLKTCKLKSSCYCDVSSEYEKYRVEDKFLTSLLAFLSNVTAPDNILQEWSMVKNLSCVSCAAWNTFTINSLLTIPLSCLQHVLLTWTCF